MKITNEIGRAIVNSAKANGEREQAEMDKRIAVEALKNQIKTFDDFLENGSTPWREDQAKSHRESLVRFLATLGA